MSNVVATLSVGAIAYGSADTRILLMLEIVAQEWLIPSPANDMRFRVPASAVRGGGTVLFVP